MEAAGLRPRGSESTDGAQPVGFSRDKQDRMARWPDNSKANFIALGLIFGLFPLLAWLCWWFLKS